MFVKSTALFFATAMTLASVSEAARTRWFSTRSCGGGAALDYQNLDWYAVLIEEVGTNQRISSHNQNSCTSRSQVGQFYGPACNTAGATAIRSMWIACPGQKAMDANTRFITLNETTSDVPTQVNTDV